MLHVRNAKTFPLGGNPSILIRGTNWIGDVIMTLPAVATIRKNLPEARISVLAKPWVAEIYRLSPHIDGIIPFESPGRHEGISGIWRLASDLRSKGFDGVILLQNAIEAAIIATLAGIPLRAGYNTDGRGFLLTHSVKRTGEIRRVHQIDYYLEMLRALGFHPAGREVILSLGEEYDGRTRDILSAHHVSPDTPCIGTAPGAAYGPAKMWFPDRFAQAAQRLAAEQGAAILIFGSDGDRERAEMVEKEVRRGTVINLAGKTNLKEAVALIARCMLFLSNDSGLMHLAGALGIPLVAVFGSTNPVTTSPVGKNSVVIYKNADCSPCLKKTCPTDFRCMDMVTVEDVYQAAHRLLEEADKGKTRSGTEGENICQ